MILSKPVTMVRHWMLMKRLRNIGPVACHGLCWPTRGTRKAISMLRSEPCGTVCNMTALSHLAGSIFHKYWRSGDAVLRRLWLVRARCGWRPRTSESGQSYRPGAASQVPARRLQHAPFSEASEANSVAHAVVERAERAQRCAECLSARKRVMGQAGESIEALSLPS